MFLKERKKDWRDMLQLWRGSAADKLHAAAFFSIVLFCIWLPVRNAVNVSFVKIIPDMMIVALFFWYAVTIRWRFHLQVQDWLFAGFLVLGAVASFFVNDIGILPILFQIRSVAIYYLLYFVVRHLHFGKREFSLMVDVLQVMAIILFAFAAIEKISSKTLLYPAFISENIVYSSNFARVYGLLANPNTYALFLVLVVFLSIGRCMFFEVSTPAAVYGMIFASLLLTMSRSGLLALGMGLLALAVYAIWHWRRSLPFKRIGASLAVAVVIGCAGYFGIKEGAVLYYNAFLAEVGGSDTDEGVSAPSGDDVSTTVSQPATSTQPVTGTTTVANDPGEEITQNVTDFGTSDRFDDMFSSEELANSRADGRLHHIEVGLQVLRDHPVFGTGFGTFGSAATQSFSSPIAEQYGLSATFYADNEYIKILAENGLVGFLLFAGFFVALLWRSRKEFFKVFLLFVLAWFGLFFNICEVQIGTMICWSVLAMPFPSKSKTDETLAKAG